MTKNKKTAGEIFEKIMEKFMILVVFIIILVSAFWGIMFLRQQYIKEIYSLEEFNKINSGVVYFGKDTYPDFKEFDVILNEILTEQKVKVYRINTDFFRRAVFFRQNYISGEDILDSILEEYKITSVPSLLNKYTGKVLDLSIFNEQESADFIKNEVKNFILEVERPAIYIPQYTILIITYIFSITFFFSMYFLEKHIDNSNKKFILRLLSIFIIIISFFLKISISNSLNYHKYAGNLRIIFLIYFNYIINILSLINIFSIDTKNNSENLESLP